MVDSERLKNQLGQIKQEVLERKQKADKEAQEKVRREQERERQTRENWPVFQIKLISAFDKINRELFENHGTVCGWRSVRTEWSFQEQGEWETQMNSEGYDLGGGYRYYTVTRKIYIEMAELKINGVGKLFAYRIPEDDSIQIGEESDTSYIPQGNPRSYRSFPLGGKPSEITESEIIERFGINIRLLYERTIS